MTVKHKIIEFVRQDGAYVCALGCGKTRATLRGVQRHQKKFHPAWKRRKHVNPAR